MNTSTRISKYLTLLSIGFFCLSYVWSGELKIAFDLDGTLIQEEKCINIKEEYFLSQKAFRLKTQGHGGKEEETCYYIHENALDLILNLKSFKDAQGDDLVDIYLYSGGSDERNKAIIQKFDEIVFGGQGRFAQLITQTFGSDDLRDIPACDQKSSYKDRINFWDKRKKDLTKIDADLRRVILVDDNYFAYNAQEKHVLGIGQYYFFFNHINDVVEAYFDKTGWPSKDRVPTTKLEWLTSLKKLHGVERILREAIAIYLADGGDFAQIVNRLTYGEQDSSDPAVFYTGSRVIRDAMEQAINELTAEERLDLRHDLRLRHAASI